MGCEAKNAPERKKSNRTKLRKLGVNFLSINYLRNRTLSDKTAFLSDADGQTGALNCLSKNLRRQAAIIAKGRARDQP